LTNNSLSLLLILLLPAFIHQPISEGLIQIRILCHVLPVNLLDHPVFLASGGHYSGYQSDNTLFTKPLWLHIKLLKQDNRFIYVTCFIIINQLAPWNPPVNYYYISRRQGSTFNPRHSVSWHQLSGTLSYETFCHHHHFQGTCENWTVRSCIRHGL